MCFYGGPSRNCLVPLEIYMVEAQAIEKSLPKVLI